MGCARFAQPQILTLRSNQGDQSMEKFIHEENLALFKKRLAEQHTDAEREVLLKLLADEKMKELLPNNSILQPQRSTLRNRGSGA